MLQKSCIFATSFKRNCKMKHRMVFVAFAALLALTGCRHNRPAGFDWDNNDRIEYLVDYTVSFAADHDSTMRLVATSNNGTAKVVQVESENLIGEDGKLVKNTFIILEDSVPTGMSITLNRGGLSYNGGKPEFIHNQTVGSDDMVEIRITGSDDYPMYSIRDNMFYDPYDAQSLTIPGGRQFSIVLPVVTEQRYPKEKESHTIQIDFGIDR